MSITVYNLIDNASSTKTGDVVAVDNAETTFDIVISGTATVVLEVSNDHTAKSAPGSVTWQTVATITASGGYENFAPWLYWRARVSAYTSGAVNVRMGLNDQ